MLWCRSKVELFIAAPIAQKTNTSDEQNKTSVCCLDHAGGRQAFMCSCCTYVLHFRSSVHSSFGLLFLSNDGNRGPITDHYQRMLHSSPYAVNSWFPNACLCLRRYFFMTFKRNAHTFLRVMRYATRSKSVDDITFVFSGWILPKSSCLSWCSLAPISTNFLWFKYIWSPTCILFSCSHQVVFFGAPKLLLDES